MTDPENSPKEENLSEKRKNLIEEAKKLGLRPDRDMEP